MLLRIRDGDFGIPVVNGIDQKDRYASDCLYSRVPIDASAGDRSYTFGASLIQVEGLRTGKEILWLSRALLLTPSIKAYIIELCLIVLCAENS